MVDSDPINFINWR